MEEPINLAGMRIGLLTASASRAGGGVFEAVVLQADMIAQAGGVPVVFALHDADSARDRTRFGDAEVSYARVTGPAQIGFAPELSPLLAEANLDLLHLHGIWMYPSRAGATWAGLTGRPYLVSPHGMLDPWITARGRWKKALARFGYERASWRQAFSFHALTEREADDVRRETGRDETIVIPNPGPEPVTQIGEMPPPRIGYLGRIHPKKNLVALIDGWQMLHESGALPGGAELTIAGWGDDADVAVLRDRLAGAPDSARFVGPLFGADKAELFASSRFMALPSHSEGLPMGMLEAWASGTPTLMTAECNLPEGFAAGAAIDCGYDGQTIATAIRKALEMDEIAWRMMADAARDLAASRFARDAIAARWAAAYTDARKGAA